jgi:hypothetical protein
MLKWLLVAVSGVGIFSAGAYAQNALTVTEQTEGFQLLFDGKTRQSFNDNFVTYHQGQATNTDLPPAWVYNATLQAITTTSNSVDLRSVKMYKDFDLRLEYRNDGNEGVFYRGLLTQPSLWLTGIELAIDAETQKNAKVSAGAAYDLYAPNPVTYKPRSTNAWNTLRIVVIGDSVEHWMNGSKIVAFKYHTPDFWTRYEASKWKTAGYTLTNVNPAQKQNSDYIHEGYIGFQGDHHGLWEIRTLRINSTKPYFGPEHTPTVLFGKPGRQGLQEQAIVRQSHGNLSLLLGNTGARTISLVAANGTVRAGELSADGQAHFYGLQPGSYFLDMGTPAGNVVQKLMVLP